ncbi:MULTISPECIES: hypothetical protein [Sphingobacteriaceae]|uniref:hypothetical protein n=1 Tax=Sphingobacteriaceae TaxID=84566 RepID=UPI001300A999|nr:MULTISPECIES: hypothetical protein [Sphingobacteriaceae]WAC40549.1 hypothetical protein OVA16_18590 [Pedobacter sp. SL55]
MQDNQKNENPFVLKRSRLSSAQLAEVVGVSESLVKKVRTGDRGLKKTVASEAVKTADHLLYEGENALIEAVKKMVRL